MSERSYPFVDGTTTDAEFSAMFRQLFPSSVLGYYGSPALGLVADSSGLRATLQPGTAFVRGHFYRNIDPLVINIKPNTSGQARVDTLVLHLEYGDVKKVSARVLEGQPGLGAPELVRTQSGIYQEPLYDVAVPAGAPTIGPGQLTDRRRWWGLEFLRMAGVAVGPISPAAGEAFLHVKTL